MKTLLCIFFKGKVITIANNGAHCEHQEYKCVVTWLSTSWIHVLGSNNVLSKKVTSRRIKKFCSRSMFQCVFYQAG